MRLVLAVDGKAMRANLRGTNPMHLLSALDHAAGVAVAQVSVNVKTNEIPLFATLVDQIPDLEEVLFTGDALHARSDTSTTCTDQAIALVANWNPTTQ